MICPTCHREHDAPAPQWTLFVPLRPPSQNETIHMKGSNNSHAWRKERAKWTQAIADAMTAQGVPQATGKRRIVMTRVYASREQQRDYGNLVGGMKLVLDAMRPTRTSKYTSGPKKGLPITTLGAGLIVDDDPPSIEDVYLQERSTCGQSGLRIEITDIGPGTGQLSLSPATVPDQEEVTSS